MARQIIRGRAVVADDWTYVDDQDPVPAGKAVVSVPRLLQDADGLVGRSAPLGVRVQGEDDVRALADMLDDVDLIVVDFPKFSDGRGYSHARILRDQLGYRGELRATGDVLRDQIFYMSRVGFDAFEPAAGHDPRAVMRGLDDFTVTYQAAADDPRPLFRRTESRKSA